MALLVLAYPRLAPTDFEWIQKIRAQHDERYFHVVAPHFTLVFPVQAMEERALIDHLARQIAGAGPIAFVSRCAIVVEDHSKAFSHVFLVPDQGLGDVVKLHDRLYTGILAPELRLDIPFIPHIGIGNSADAPACKRLADELNARGFRLEGRIDALDIVCYENDHVHTIEQIPLS